MSNNVSSNSDTNYVWIVYRLIGWERELEIVFATEDSANNYVYSRNYYQYEIEQERVYV